MDYEIEQIVKIVLYKLGQLKQTNIISTLNYPVDLKKQLEDAFVIIEQEKVSACTLGTDIWIPELTCKQLMSIYQGIPSDHQSEIVVEALLKGYKVTVLSTSVELLQMASIKTPFTKRYFEALDLLEQSGLKIMKTVNTLEDAMKNVKKDAEITKQNDAVSGEKVVDLEQKVLTESQLIHYIQQHIEVVNIKPTTIITPSAQDFIRQNPIRLNRK
ncbi:hypothetical protein [Fusibacter bizertensis]